MMHVKTWGIPSPKFVTMAYLRFSKGESVDGLKREGQGVVSAEGVSAGGVSPPADGGVWPLPRNHNLNSVSFAKTGFTGFETVKPGFGVQFRFWKSRNCIHCKSSAVGVEVGRWVVGQCSLVYMHKL